MSALLVLGFGPCSKGEPVGVKDCDAYLDRYDDCVKTLSDEEQAARAPEGQTMRKVLREEAQRPESKEKVAEHCRAALAALKDCT